MVIDFHTHILPGIDDGSSDLQMSMAMLNEERHQGVDVVVLTPHFLGVRNRLIILFIKGIKLMLY